MKKLARVLLASSLLAGALHANPARAQSGTWINSGGGSWENAANWQGGNIAQGPDGTADFSTLNLGADATVTLDGAQTIGLLIFGDKAAAHNWILNTGSGGPLTLEVSTNPTPTITVNNQTATIGLSLSGSQGLTKAGLGALILDGANTYTGVTTVSNGTLGINAMTLTAANTLNIESNSIVQLAGTLALNANSSGTAVEVTGAGTLQLISTTNSATAPDLNFDANDTPNSTANYGARVACTVDLGDAQRFIWGRTDHNGVGAYHLTGADCQFAGAIIGSGGMTFIGQDNHTGSNPMETPFCLNASNSFTGPVEIQRGSIYLGNAGALSQTNVLFFNAASGNNARLFLYGNSIAVSNLSSTTSGNNLIADANGTPDAYGPVTLTIFQGVSGTFTGSMVDYFAEYGVASGTQVPQLSLVLNGPGALTLSGPNTYSGSTTINSGALVIPTLQTGGGPVSVADGATLGINVVSANTLPMSALTLGNSASSAVNFAFSGNPSASVAPVTATNLTVNGGANAVTINLTLNGGVTPGQFPLIKYAGGIGGTGYSAFKLGVLPSYLTAALVNNAANNSIDLSVTAVAQPEWSGLLSSQWSANILPLPKNWVFVTDGKTPADYTDGSAALFNDVATGTTTVNVSVANVSPASVIFNNSANNYTLTGSYGIAGATGLVKTGAGSLTIQNSNSFTGPVSISGGTVSVNSDAALGAVPAVPTPASVVLNAATLSAAATTTLAANRGLALGPSSGAGGGTLDAANGAIFTITAPLVNNGTSAASLKKTGAGQVILAASPTYSGGTSNAGGTLTLSQSQSFTSSSFLGIASNAVVESAGSLNFVVNASDTAIDVTGGGLLRLTSTDNGTNSPDLYFGPNHSGNTDYGARLASALDLGSVQRFIFGKTGHNGVGEYGLTASDCQFAGSISGSGGMTFIAQNTYTGSPMMEVPFCLNASNSFTGPVELQRGSIYLGNPHAFPVGDVLRFNLASGNNGRFFLYGLDTTISDLEATNNGTAVIADGNEAPGNVGPATLTVIQNNSDTFNGTLQDVQAEYGGSGSLTPTLSFVKGGPATLTLGGNNTYSGSTIISAGTLALGFGASLDTTPAISITPGGVFDITASGYTLGQQVPQTLVAGRPSSFGTDVNGTLGTTTGSIVNVAGSGVAGTLTINGDLSLQGGNVLLDLAAAPTAGAGVNDLISVSGTLYLGSPTTITPNFLAGRLGLGSYTLFKASSVSGDINNLALLLPSGGRQTYALDDTTTPGSVLLQVGGSNPADLLWLGTNGSAWDTSTINWLNGAAADKFYNGDSVTFNDTATNGWVSLAGSLQPSSVTVSNKATSYVFEGAGSLDGLAALTKSGPGPLLVVNSNTFSGLTLINGGTLQVDTNGTTGSLGSGVVSNNATLVIERGDVFFLTNNVSGSGLLKQTGAGTLVLLGTNDYSGPTVIAAGLLQVGNGGASGSLGTGPVTNNTVLVLDRGDLPTVNNYITGPGLVTNLAGAVTLSGASAYSGGTYIEGGTVVAASATALGSGNVFIDTGSVGTGALYFNFPSGSAIVLANNINLPINAGGLAQDFLIEGNPTNFTTVRLTGVISGGDGETYRLADSGVSGNDYNVTLLDNPSNTFSGNIQLWRGTIAFTSDGALGATNNSVEIDTWSLNGSLRFDADNITLNSNRIITLDSGGNESINVQSFTGTIAGVITGPGPFVKLGAGALILNGDNTYSSTTTINAGALLVNGALESTAVVEVTSNATLGGLGTVTGPVTVDGTVAPGANNSVGTLTTGAETWDANGRMTFSLNNATNGAGWSLLNITDGLNLSASAASPFTIKLVSLTSSNTPGPITGFNPATSNVWTIATTASGFTNFNAGAFVVDTTAFANPLTGFFKVATNGNSLVLTYTVVSSPPAVSGLQRLLNGMFSLSLTGTPGTGFTVHATTNLALRPLSAWQVLGSGTLEAGPTPFDDSTSTNYPNRFYLISTP